MEQSEGLPLLSDEDLDRLTEDELAVYYELLKAEAEEWRLTPKQATADALFDEVDELCYGGAAGGAKSELIIYRAMRLSQQYPRHRVLVLRKGFPELRRSLIWRSIHRYAEQQVDARYKATDKEWHFPNQSVIEFGYADQEEDVRQYLSAEYDAIFIDESTDFTGSMIEMLRSRLRTTREKRKAGVRPHLGLFTNPGGPGHDFHKERYVDPTGKGERIVEKLDDPNDPESIRRIAYVHATVFDNPHIDPAYKRNLMALTDPIKRAQYLDGDWSIFAGQFFPEFKAEVHVVQPFTIPKDWPRVRAIDFGIRHPFCCLWVAFDQDGNAYVYRELFGSGYTATEQARMILSASGAERYDRTVADPSIWNRSGEGVPIASIYRKAGLICSRAMNARVDGWNLVREFLRGGPTWQEVERAASEVEACEAAGDHGPRWAQAKAVVEAGRNALPALRIFAGACPNLVRELPKLQHDDDNSDDCEKIKHVGLSDDAASDDACLVAGTLVTTKRGAVPIEYVRRGDLVWTRAGWRRVLDAGQTGTDRPVVELVTMYGSVRCTPDHPIAAPSGEFLQAQHTTHCVMLPEWTRSSSARRARSSAAPATTSAEAGTSSGTDASFTARSGQRPTGRSLPGATSTIATRTEPTTGSRTSRSSTGGSTWRTTLASALRRVTLRRDAGSKPVRPATPGSPRRSDPVRLGPDGRRLPSTPSPASSAAEGSTPRSPRGPSSAAGPAGLVTSAVVAVRRAGRADVFNLVVEDQPEFFANGILVHNCDTLRYALMTRHRAAAARKPERPNTIEERIAQRLEERDRDRRRPKHPVLGRM